jgi:sulfite exporter TauE/SafE
MGNPAYYLSEGLLLGLATGPLCLVSCGPVYAPFLMQKNRSTGQSIVTLLQLSAGRFLTYLLIGIAAGALGAQIASLTRPWFTAAAYTTFSVILVVSAMRTKRCDEGCSPMKWTRFAETPFILGMATGISLCPSFLLALTKAVAHGGMLAGALLFGAFFLGTTLYFVPIVIFGMIGKTYRLRMIGRIASCIVAAWFIGQAVLILVK